MLPVASGDSNVLLERRILLVVLFTSCYPVHTELEFHLAGKQCSTHVGITTIRCVSISFRPTCCCVRTDRKIIPFNRCNIFRVNCCCQLDNCRKINPVENISVSIVAMGEGWHNYHHVFPWDYKAAELAHRINITTFWIQFFAKLGWAYDLKEPTPELVRRTIERCGKF